MEVDTGAAEGARWAGNDDDVVWCESGAGLLDAVADGHFKVEVGGAEPGPLLDSVASAADCLESLSITGCGLDVAALARLGASLGPTQIRGVGISNNPGIELLAWGEFFAKLPSTIVRWDLGDNGLPDDVLPALVAAIARSEVQELFLDGNDLGNIRPLLSVIDCSIELGELDIGDNNIDDACVGALVDVLPSTSIKTLVLGRNPISDAGGIPLAYSLPRTRIATLHLDSTKVGSATLDALVDVLADTRLEELHLDGTCVDDAGVLRLCRALPSSKVCCLDVGDNNLSETTISAIQAALPADVAVE